MVRAIMVDMGGVLLHSAWAALSARWDAELGLPPGGFLQALYGGSDDTVLIGRVSEDEWWEGVCRKLGGDSTLRSRFQTDLAEGEWLDTKMTAFLSSLRVSHRLALVSNAWPCACRRARHHWNLDELFHETVFSCEVGVAKPAAKIYYIACERTGVVPAEALFIDDDRKNVEAAAALGMQALLFTDVESAIQQVRLLLNTEPEMPQRAAEDY